jgi:hypothetical protein
MPGAALAKRQQQQDGYNAFGQQQPGVAGGWQQEQQQPQQQPGVASGWQQQQPQQQPGVASGWQQQQPQQQPGVANGWQQQQSQQQPGFAGGWQQQQPQQQQVQQLQYANADGPWQQRQQQLSSPQQQHEQHSSWMQQQRQPGLQQQSLFMHGGNHAVNAMPQAAAHTHPGTAQMWHSQQQQQQQEPHSMWPAQQPQYGQHLPGEGHQQHLLMQQQGCAGAQQDWPQQPWAAQPLTANQQQEQGWQQEQQLWQQAPVQPPLASDVCNQPQHDYLEDAYADEGCDIAGSDTQLQLAADDARQLLERFDESLVDLLVEVERLEQQQQARRRRQQQSHPQQQQRHARQQQEQLLLQQGGGLQQGIQHGQRGHVPAQHGDQWVAQQQQQRQRQHLHEESPQQWYMQQHAQSGAGGHLHQWPTGAAVAVHAQPEDDEVSDILNC